MCDGLLTEGSIELIGSASTSDLSECLLTPTVCPSLHNRGHRGRAPGGAGGRNFRPPSIFGNGRYEVSGDSVTLDRSMLGELLSSQRSGEVVMPWHL